MIIKEGLALLSMPNFEFLKSDHNKWRYGQFCETKSICNYRPRSREIMYLVAPIRPSVRHRSHGSALPSAAKSKEESFSVYCVCLCVE